MREKKTHTQETKKSVKKKWGKKKERYIFSASYRCIRDENRYDVIPQAAPSRTYAVWYAVLPYTTCTFFFFFSHKVDVPKPVPPLIRSADRIFQAPILSVCAVIVVMLV